MKILQYIPTLLLSLSSMAQNAPDSLFCEMKFKNGTLHFDNVLLDSYLDSGSIGNASLHFFQHNNQFKDAYTPDKTKGFRVQTERFIALKGWRFYGSFSFSKFQDLGSRYAEMVNPYRDNPYKIVDSLTADWNKQHYVLQTNIVTPYLNRYTRAGIGVQYEVLNGARQKDPRPLDNTINIKLTPSLLFELSPRLHLGINGLYNRYIEDISVSIANTQRPQNVYKTLGLGEYLYSRPIQLSGGLSRKYIGNAFGGGIGIVYGISEKQQIKMALNYKSYQEDATDGTSAPYQAGRHRYHELDAKISYYRKSTFMDQTIDIAALHRDNKDKEYIQTLDQASQQYKVIFESDMHFKTSNFLSLQYGNIIRNSKKAIAWQLKAGGNIMQYKETYPSTNSLEQVANILFNWEVGRMLTTSIGDFALSYSGRYKQNLNKQLHYTANDNSSNFVANYILFPNYNFNTANVWSNKIDLRYYIPVKSLKSSNLYISTSFERIAPLSNSNLGGKGTGNNYVTFTIGLIN